MQHPRKTRRTIAGAVMSLLVVAFMLAPALAATGTPDGTWMTNGTVYSLARSGNYVYAGGQFTKELQNPPGQAGEKFGSVGIARFNAATGDVDKSWKVSVTNADGTRATVRAVAVADGKVFFGGTFDRVNGEVRSNIAAVSETDGSLTSFAPVMNKNVMSMIANGSTVYVGGAFTTVDGLGRSRLAAFNTSGALLNTWRPRASAEVRSVILDCTGTKVYAGGRFLSASGTASSLQPRDSVALFDAATGALDPWATQDADIGNGANVYDLAVSCANQELVAGIGGVNFLYAFDTSDNVGEALWSRQSSGNVQTVAVTDRGTADPTDDRVLFGGHFGGGVTYPSGACAESKPKTSRFGFADLDGNCDLSWWPNFEGKFYGPWDILVTDNGDTAWVGGQYTQVCDGITNACTSQYFLSRFSDV